MNYTIRKIKENERVLLEDFLYEAIFIPEGVTPPDRSVVEQAKLQLYVRDFGTYDHDHALLAEVNGMAVGAVWTRIINDYGHVDDQTPSLSISLYPAYRNRGIGTAMMQEMLHHLKEKGYRHVSLSVQKTNYAAKWYQQLGFKVIQENSGDYIMIKQL
ncbi:MAG: GNAT family N-acetyltransferase [Eikenella sp.]|nr:GNAT family N-acetyltransferase [Eikenella sp.]